MSKDRSAIARRGLSVDEVMATYGFSRQFVYDLLNDGRLRSIKVGRRRIIPVAALEEFEQQSGNVA